MEMSENCPTRLDSEAAQLFAGIVLMLLQYVIQVSSGLQHYVGDDQIPRSFCMVTGRVVQLSTRSK